MSSPYREVNVRTPEYAKKNRNPTKARGTAEGSMKSLTEMPERAGADPNSERSSLMPNAMAAAAAANTVARVNMSPYVPFSSSHMHRKGPIADEMVNDSEKYPMPSPLRDAGRPSTTAALIAVPASP